MFIARQNNFSLLNISIESIDHTRSGVSNYVSFENDFGSSRDMLEIYYLISSKYCRIRLLHQDNQISELMAQHRKL